MRAKTTSGLGLIVWLLSVASLGAASTDQRLLDAVKDRNLQAVRALLKQRVDVNAPQADGATALHWATYWDDPDTVDLLTRAGANVNAANELGVTPLALACANANATIVEKLLKAGADANAAAMTGETVLMSCARTGNVAAVKALLAHDAKVNAAESEEGQTALMWAAAQGHVEVVRVLVAQGADVQAQSAIRPCIGPEVECSHPQQGNFTPLLFAARHGNPETARILLDAGARVNHVAAEGSSALPFAAHNGHRALAMYLLERGANPNAADAGYTALHAAVLRGDVDLVKALLARGADPNLRVARGHSVIRMFSHDWGLGDTIGATAFFLAAKYAEFESMQALAAGGADPLLAMPDGTTPLMAAAGIGWGIGEDRRGRELNSLAQEELEDTRRNMGSVKLAVELGADVNAVNKDGDTALHGAAGKGIDPVVQFLLEKGAAVNVKNKRGVTPLRLAAGDRGVIPVLGLNTTVDLLRKFGGQ